MVVSRIISFYKVTHTHTGKVWKRVPGSHQSCRLSGHRLCLLVSFTHPLSVLSHFSCVQLVVTPWTVAHQAPLSMRFSWQEYWSGLPCPPPEDLPDPGIKPLSLKSLALAGGFFTTSTTWEACFRMWGTAIKWRLMVLLSFRGCSTALRISS